MKRQTSRPSRKSSPDSTVSAGAAAGITSIPLKLISTLSSPLYSTPLSSFCHIHTHPSPSSLSLSLSLHHMSNCLPVKLTGCLIPHGKRQEEEEDEEEVGLADQGDYENGGRSPICLLINRQQRGAAEGADRRAPKKQLTEK